MKTLFFDQHLLLFSREIEFFNHDALIPWPWNPLVNIKQLEKYKIKFYRIFQFHTLRLNEPALWLKDYMRIRIKIVLSSFSLQVRGWQPQQGGGRARQLRRAQGPGAMRCAGVQTEVMPGQAPQHLQQVGDQDDWAGEGNQSGIQTLETPELYLSCSLSQ